MDKDIPYVTKLHLRVEKSDAIYTDDLVQDCGSSIANTLKIFNLLSNL